MKHKKYNIFIRSIILITLLTVIMIISAIGLFYYAFSIPIPEGLSLASWAERFTDNFSTWIIYEDNQIDVTEIGIERLDEYNLWIQILDESGQEIFSHNKPKNISKCYTTSELLELEKNGCKDEYTLFVSCFKNYNINVNYIIGFPYSVGKYRLYYNGERISRLSPMFKIVIFIVMICIFSIIIGYNIWLSQKLSKITDSINKILCRNFHKLEEKGTFVQVYHSLNVMDSEISNSDKIRKDTEIKRKEWITNITHDLKTPLSPIKGYAELLADNLSIESETVKEYALVIMKNAVHVEKLINDLKLTYQLDAGTIPYYPQSTFLVRFIRELVIDIINDPVFSNRRIEFECDIQDFKVCIDPDLFRRAVQNLIINAFIHNPIETKIFVQIKYESEKNVNIVIRDNGNGISKEEQKNLFNRYYRGTNTKEKSEGSGLGLAIAKQIINLHDGEIHVESEIGKGTEFCISIPIEN